MNLIQRAIAGIAGMAGLQASEARDANDPRWWGLQAIVSMSGVPVTCESALQLATVQSVLGRLGGTISTLPMMVFRRTGDDTREAAPDHPLFRVLHRQPNARQTAQEFRDEQERHLAWWRNAYARILPAKDGGPVGELEPIHPTRVLRVERGTDGWIYYTVRRLPPGIGQDVYREDEIWHLRRAPLTEDGLRGKPMWEIARETFGRAQAVEQFGALFFANGGAGGGTLEHPGNFKDKADRDAFLDNWRQGGAGPNRHKDRLLTHGVKYNRDTIQNDEAQFLETKREMKYELASLWNMPGHMVGLLDRSTNNNIEHQGLEYVTHTIAPDVVCWEQSAWKDLLVGDDQDEYFVELNVAGLLRGDFKTRMQGFAWARQWGWLSVNDVRRFENLPPIGPAGDVYLQPLNMQPAGEKQDPDHTKDDPPPGNKDD